VVYPALRVFCLRRRVDFSWIDFRWGGVTEQDSERHLGVVRCLDKVGECAVALGANAPVPVLVGLVGERVGWVPGKDSEDREVARARYSWVGEEEFERYSVTALEMAHAFLRQVLSIGPGATPRARRPLVCKPLMPKIRWSLMPKIRRPIMP
jgi:hypothetical protein